jgi:hypothetical protein
MSPEKNSAPTPASLNDPQVSGPPYQVGANPEMDAWMTSFFIENHLDYLTYPDHAATEEQVRFMVYTDDGERYYPCSDRMFEAILTRNKSAFIQKDYARALQHILKLIKDQIEDPYEKNYLESLMVYKHKHETRDEIMIPSRIEKRLLTIYLKRTLISDPFHEAKYELNQRALSVLESSAYRDALNHVEQREIENPPGDLAKIKSLIAAVEFKRLLALSNSPRLWQVSPPQPYQKKDILSFFEKPLTGNGVGPLFDLLCMSAQNEKTRKLLWLIDESGEMIFDLAVIRFLTSCGHKVIVALKSGPLFTKATLQDFLSLPLHRTPAPQFAVINDPAMSKNELVRMLRGDTPVLALSDGTMENLNLLLTSTTFARIFKEVDAVVSRGTDQRRRFFETHFQFTQDIYNISCDEDGSLSILLKPRHPAVIKFSHEDLESKARTIIARMKEAKAKGMTVIFYSGIIGSIPGKIEMAKRIMSVFVKHLTEQSALTFIINPSEYYEPGMDADDLMYMWEIVQRSGHIDIWRFQTYDDIAAAFKLMAKKIPPEWVGTDATYSTGCTNEMAIAIDVQKRHPEMQLIGPPQERFMRRFEYGVGKMHDRRLSD